MRRCMYELPHYKTSRAYIQWFTNYRYQTESYTATMLLKYVLKKTWTKLPTFRRYIIIHLYSTANLVTLMALPLYKSAFPPGYHKLIAGNSKVWCWDGIQWCNVHINFHRNWATGSKLKWGNISRGHTQRERWSRTSIFLLKREKYRLKSRRKIIYGCGSNSSSEDSARVTCPP
jgi:hypothetical protein